MNRQAYINEIRSLVGSGQIDKALTYALTAADGTDPLVDRWQSTLLQLQTRLEQIRQEERQGTVSFDNARLVYNQVTQDLLEVTEEIEAGRPPVREASAPAEGNRRWLIGAMALLVVVVAGWLLRNTLFGPAGPEEEELPQEAAICPEFAPESIFNVMVFPFQALRGNPTRVHVAIRDRLAVESDAYRINTSIRSANIDPDADLYYPASGSDAERLVSPCRAQLVIWGTTENSGNAGDIILTRFRFLTRDSVQLSKLQITESMEVDTVVTLSSVATDGVLTETIEQNIRYLFGLIAHQMDDDALAASILEQFSPDPADEDKLRQWGMVLQDAYLQQGREEEAHKVLDQVIAGDPDNYLARNNRGLLYFRKGQFAEAAEDLGVAAAQAPADTLIEAARALANIRIGRLDRVDVSLFRNAPLQAPIREQIEEEYREEKQEQNEMRRRADATLRTDPTNLRALQTKADAVRNLGNYSEATRLYEQLMAAQPRSAAAVEGLVDIKLEQRDTAAATQLLENARLNNVSPLLLRRAPVKRGVN